jgi:hypothetical protein
MFLYEKHKKKFPTTKAELEEVEQFLWERTYKPL